MGRVEDWGPPRAPGRVLALQSPAALGDELCVSSRDAREKGDSTFPPQRPQVHPDWTGLAYTPTLTPAVIGSVLMAPGPSPVPPTGLGSRPVAAQLCQLRPGSYALLTGWGPEARGLRAHAPGSHGPHGVPARQDGEREGGGALGIFFSEGHSPCGSGPTLVTSSNRNHSCRSPVSSYSRSGRQGFRARVWG